MAPRRPRLADLFAGAHPDHLAHEVDAVTLLGDRVLDLQACVHLQEVERAARVEELDGAGADVADLLGEVAGGLAHLLAQLRSQHGARRLLDQLLVTTLHRALALAVVHDVAVLVGHDLDLDVARLEHELLEVDPVVAERALRLSASHPEGLEQPRLVLDDADALAAAAGRSLEHDRVVDLLGGSDEVVLVDVVLQAGDERHPGLERDVARGHLVTHRRDRVARRAEELDPRLRAGPREGSVLAQEPVARMQRVALKLLRDGQHLVCVEVALCRRASAEARGEARLAHVQRHAVGVREDCHRLDAHLLGGADDAQRDLPSVGDQDSSEQRHIAWVA